MSLQLSAYKAAEFFYDKDTKISTPFIKIDELAILLLGEEGYSYHQAPDKLKHFLYAYEIYKFLNPEKVELLNSTKEAQKYKSEEMETVLLFEFAIADGDLKGSKLFKRVRTKLSINPKPS